MWGRCGRLVQRRPKLSLLMRQPLVTHRLGAIELVDRASCLVPSTVYARQRVPSTFMEMLSNRADDDL